jgi:hypothetical protein
MIRVQRFPFFLVGASTVVVPDGLWINGRAERDLGQCREPEPERAESGASFPMQPAG